MKKSVISIIVPCYNNEKYIARCLNSIVNQTFNQIEIIIVNDGSTDKSISIIEDYASKDSRIIIVDKSNEGVSAARNDGIKKSTCKYLMFVDSDDWIDLNTCEVVYDKIEKSNADVVMWSYVREFANASLKKNIYNEKIIVFNKTDIKNKLYRRQIGLIDEELEHPESEFALNPVFTKIFRKDIIIQNNIKFIDLSIIGTSEDGYFNMEVFEHCEKVIYIDEYFYHYFKQNDNSCTQNYKADLFIKWQKLFDITLMNINKNIKCKDNIQAFNNKICLSIIWLGLNICSSKKNSFQKIKEIKGILSCEKYRQAYRKLNFNHFRIHWKIFFLCSKYNFATGVFLMLLIMKKMIGKK